MPWLFWAAARILLPPCPPHSEEQSSTVVINGLDPKEHTTTAIRRYFGRRFPRIQLQELVWAKDTRYLRRELWKFKFAQEVRQELLSTLDPHACSWLCPVTCGSRDLNYWTARERELWLKIEAVRRKVHSGDYNVRLLFLTVGSPQQAYRLQMLEENLGSTYRRMSLAPRNQDIVWDNMKSGTLMWTYYVCWGALLLFIWSFGISPFVWEKTFLKEQLIDKFGLAGVADQDAAGSHQARRGHGYY